MAIISSLIVLFCLIILHKAVVHNVHRNVDCRLVNVRANDVKLNRMQLKEINVEYSNKLLKNTFHLHWNREKSAQRSHVIKCYIKIGFIAFVCVFIFQRKIHNFPLVRCN